MKYVIPILLFVSEVTSLQLRIDPSHLDAGVSGAVFRVICTSDEPLTHCHFKWRDIYNNDGPLIDLSEGPKTPVATNYSYSGNGLEKGQCGINLNRPTGVQRWVVCCRVRSKDSGWHYAHMTLFAHLKSATSLNTSSTQITVRPGENATIKCNSDNLLIGCVFRLPDGSYPSFELGPGSPSANSYRYFGSGLNSGECGISLLDVTASSNGFVWCQAWKSGHDEWRSFAITVPGTPSIPVLEVKSSNYSEGDMLSVLCTVTNALPVANLRWYLDEEVIRQDHVNEAYTEPWLWPFEVQTIKQTLTRKLKSTDNGKVLTCKIKQSDNMPELQGNYTITFLREYKVPDSVDLKLASNKYNEGNILSANCTVRGGYPLPQIIWFLGSKNLTRKVVSLNNSVLVETVMEPLQAEDNAQKLKCIVHHPRLFQPVQRTLTIIVEHSPQLAHKTLERFKFKIGSPSVATVEIFSNPRPIIYWTVDDFILEEGATDVTGCYEAALLVKNFNNLNVWVAQLYINNVTLKDFKTNFFLSARNQYGDEYFRCLNFNITEPADVIGQPKMLLSPVVDIYPVGTMVKATCTVTRNRPVAAIKWLLSNMTLTKGMSNPILLQTIPQDKHVMSQSITLQVGENDDGSQLTCIAGNKQTVINISVMYPPKKLNPVIEIHGFEVGKPGVLSVEISANPRPGLMWEIGGMVIREDEFAADKRFHVPQALSKAHGKWVAKLFVTNITQPDVESDFALTARNQAGSRTYRVRLYTSQPVESNNATIINSQETNVSSPITLSTTTEFTVADKNFPVTTMGVPGKTNTGTAPYYTNATKSVISGQEAVPQERKMTYEYNAIYSYLSIGNSIAIVALCILGSLVYRGLIWRLSHRCEGLERAPMCLENIYYDEMNHTERQEPGCE